MMPKILVSNLLFVVTLILLTGCSDSHAQEQDKEEQRKTVITERVSANDVVLDRSYSATTAGVRNVEIKARVNGLLMKRKYTEGDLVQEGDVLFEIEKEPYELNLQRAEAELEQAKASLREADRNWVRIQDLFQDGVVSERDYDQAKSERELKEAAVAIAETSVRDAQIELDYTLIRSPVTGVAGREMMSVGNLIEAQDKLTQVTQLDPLHANFSVPVNDYATDYLLRRNKLDDAEDSTVKAQLEKENGDVLIGNGEVDFISRQVERDTGNIEARAIFGNAAGLILPGQFVRVRLPEIVIKDTFSVPERALTQSNETTTVFVVEEGITNVKEVAIGPKYSNRVVITSGLSEGDQVIVEGIGGLKEGDAVASSSDNDENESQKKDTSS